MSHFDPTDIQAQERDAEVSADRNRKAADLEIDDLKWLMSNKRGRRFAARFLDLAGLHRPSIDQNTASMAFKEGKRWFGTLLMGEIEMHCFDRYIEMLQEQKK